MADSSNKGVAVTTGASTGIGAIYADRLAKPGYDLILVARWRSLSPDEIAKAVVFLASYDSSYVTIRIDKNRLSPQTYSNHNRKFLNQPEASKRRARNRAGLRNLE